MEPTRAVDEIDVTLLAALVDHPDATNLALVSPATRTKTYFSQLSDASIPRFSASH